MRSGPGADHPDARLFESNSALRVSSFKLPYCEGRRKRLMNAASCPSLAGPGKSLNSGQREERADLVSNLCGLLVVTRRNTRVFIAEAQRKAIHLYQAPSRQARAVNLPLLPDKKCKDRTTFLARASSDLREER